MKDSLAELIYVRNSATKYLEFRKPCIEAIDDDGDNNDNDDDDNV